MEVRGNCRHFLFNTFGPCTGLFSARCSRCSIYIFVAMKDGVVIGTVSTNQERLENIPVSELSLEMRAFIKEWQAARAFGE